MLLKKGMVPQKFMPKKIHSLSIQILLQSSQEIFQTIVSQKAANDLANFEIIRYNAI
jgi:hypothetical protein